MKILPNYKTYSLQFITNEIYFLFVVDFILWAISFCEDACDSFTKMTNSARDMEVFNWEWPTAQKSARLWSTEVFLPPFYIE